MKSHGPRGLTKYAMEWNSPTLHTVPCCLQSFGKQGRGGWRMKGGQEWWQKSKPLNIQSLYCNWNHTSICQRTSPTKGGSLASGSTRGILISLGDEDPILWTQEPQHRASFLSRHLLVTLQPQRRYQGSYTWGLRLLDIFLVHLEFSKLQNLMALKTG